MKKALNKKGNLVDIIESTKDNTYICPVCKEELTRNFGVSRQYFSHPSGKGDECELKFKLLEKKEVNTLNETEIDILNEYYNKNFDDVNIELSDYMSEEGYYLTQEQKDIIFATEDKIKISALSGSSKSTTLYYYAKERPYKKILYIVYNKAMKDEADRLYENLSNVTVKTQHGLAYNYVGKFYRNKLTLNYGVIDIIKDLNLDWNNNMELAVKINAMMKAYMLSNAIEFDDVELFIDDNGNPNDDRENIVEHCKMLWELKKKYNNKVKIEHDFYLKLFHLSKKKLSHKFDIIMVDECLPKSQYVKTDKGIKSIKTLYDWFIKGKELPQALSYNIEKDIFEYKPIIGANKSSNRQLLEITIEGLNKLQCTPNHKILTQRGYIKAEDLIIGKDSLILDCVEKQKSKYKLNEEQFQILLGSFLGDGSLNKQSNFNTYRLNFTQGEKQFEYFKSKISAFNLDYRNIKSGYTHKFSVYQSNYTKVFLLEKDIWESLKDINEIGLAIWYQDNGSYVDNRCTINSNQLTYKQTEYIRNIVKYKYNIDFTIEISKGKYYYLRANVENSRRFLSLISKYMHPIMQYKTKINISNNRIEYNHNYLNHGGNYIKSIEKIHSEDVYDIEVKDNHNFVTTKTAQNTSGIVVHNCQDLSKLLLDILISSDVPGIVICGDKYQSIYKWRNSTDIMPLFDGKEYKLTTSFRVSQNIANIANLLIKDIYKVDINMKGFNSNQKIVHEIDKSKPYACLCRTNAYILGEVIEVINNNENAKLYFEGGYYGYNFASLKDAYWFYKGHKVKNQIFNKFKSYGDMMEYAHLIEDVELLAIDRMIERYGDKIPKIIDGIKNNTVKDKDRADVLFSTCHKSKGMTFKIPIYLSDDIFEVNAVFRKEYILDDNDPKFNIENYYEETNIVYVAITRCAGEIVLPDKIKNYLIIRWKHFNKTLTNYKNNC